MLNNLKQKQPQKPLAPQSHPISHSPYHTRPNPPFPQNNNNQSPLPSELLSNNSSISINYTSHSPSPSSMKVGMSQIPKSQGEMYKIMCMMRQQIEISNSFYVSKMKVLLQGQAKEIIGLREIVVQNQRELIKKNVLITQLKQTLQKQTPKKKISVLSSNPQHQLTVQNYTLLTDKIAKLQGKLSGLETNLQQKGQMQRLLNIRLEDIEKKTLKFLATKIGACAAKLDMFMIKKEKELEKIYADCVNLSKNIVSNGNTNTTSQTNLHGSFNTKLSAVTKEIISLKQQIQILKNKQYRYDNYQVEKLHQQLIKLKSTIKQQQNFMKNASITTILEPGQGQVRDGYVNSRERQFQSQKIIHNAYNNGNGGIIHKVRSQKIIEFPNPQPIPIQNKTTYNNNSGMSGHNKNMIPIARINLNSNSIHNHNQMNNREIVDYQNVMLNHSTPPLMRNHSDSSQHSQKVIDKSGRLFANTTTNNDHMPQLAKTANLSTQASRTLSNPKPKPKQQTTPSSCSPLQHEFYQPDSPQPVPSQHSQSLCYQTQSQCQSYQQQQQPYNQNLQQRLITTIYTQNLKMPVHVEIDQTGYLKCMQTGMYLVDNNNDVFQLGDGQMEGFVRKGILRE